MNSTIYCYTLFLSFTFYFDCNERTQQQFLFSKIFICKKMTTFLSILLYQNTNMCWHQSNKLKMHIKNTFMLDMNETTRTELHAVFLQILTV